MVRLKCAPLKLMKWILCVLLMGQETGLELSAYEIDAFSGRPHFDFKSKKYLNAKNLPYPDRNQIINDYVTGKMKEAIKVYLSSSKKCDDKQRLQILRKIKYLVGSRNEVISNIETWAEGSDSLLDIRTDSVKPHIYSKSIGAIALVGLKGNLVVTGQKSQLYIGADKLGHFFDQGFELFLAYKQSGDFEAAFSRSIGLEEGNFGIRTTGVFSYGDLAANFSGFLFWKQMYEEILLCSNDSANRASFQNAWTFDFKNYWHAGWDEGINCSEYDPKVNLSVMATLKELKTSCPVKDVAYNCSQLEVLESKHLSLLPPLSKQNVPSGTWIDYHKSLSFLWLSPFCKFYF